MTEVAVQSALGERLRAIRQLRRKTLKSVASAAGISESFLSQLERGRTNATIATLQRLATALGIEVSELFRASAPRPRVPRGAAPDLGAGGARPPRLRRVGASGTKGAPHAKAVSVARDRRGSLRARRLDGRRALHPWQ